MDVVVVIGYSLFLGGNIVEFKNIIALVLVCLGIWLANRVAALKIVIEGDEK
jgi:hypothetical protein